MTVETVYLDALEEYHASFPPTCPRHGERPRRAVGCPGCAADEQRGIEPVKSALAVYLLFEDAGQVPPISGLIRAWPSSHLT